MQVIPVIDVKGGLAVAARRGDRARYAPMVSPLAESADPVAVATGLRALFPFQALYVADLDGIEGRGADLETQRRLAEIWPGELWIDDGKIAPSPGAPAPGEGAGPLIKSQLLYHRVLGSESLTSVIDYETARERAGTAAPLSLDFRGDDFIGPPELLANASLWPERVIVMTLARVGSGEGPDVTRLTSIIARAGKREIYAAGGVRDVNDLAKLQDIGAAGALVATALHTGGISRADLERFAI